MTINTITIVHSYPGYEMHQSILSREQPTCPTCQTAWFTFNDDGSVTLGIAMEDKDGAVAYITVLDVT